MLLLVQLVLNIGTPVAGRLLVFPESTVSNSLGKPSTLFFILFIMNVLAAGVGLVAVYMQRSASLLISFILQIISAGATVTAMACTVVYIEIVCQLISLADLHIFGTSQRVDTALDNLMLKYFCNSTTQQESPSESDVIEMIKSDRHLYSCAWPHPFLSASGACPPRPALTSPRPGLRWQSSPSSIRSSLPSSPPPSRTPRCSYASISSRPNTITSAPRPAPPWLQLPPLPLRRQLAHRSYAYSFFIVSSETQRRGWRGLFKMFSRGVTIHDNPHRLYNASRELREAWERAEEDKPPALRRQASAPRIPRPIPPPDAALPERRCPSAPHTPRLT